MKQIYHVAGITKTEIKEWVIKKHYAHKLPGTTIHSFGLFDETDKLLGVCLFGLGANYRESEAWKKNGYNMLELTRLVINDDHEKNLLSWFVGQCLKKIPTCTVIISYSNIDQNHHGYIYQATNWIYTGIGAVDLKTYIMNDGSIKHHRTVRNTKQIYLNMKENIKEVILSMGKHRYYYFIGNKRDKKEMKKILISRFEILPYPKGKNIKYDASYQPNQQPRISQWI